MAYLSEFEHDVFVSYAHSDLLNDWSRRLIKEMRRLVAGGLGRRSAEEVGIWWDYKLRGNEPLTDQLRKKVEGAGVLLVLMSDWYLDSAWCRDERDWFLKDVRKRGSDRVFVVRVRATGHGHWPKAFKDERGHPLIGYDFVGAADASYPKGFPSPEDSSDSKEYYAELQKLASEIVSQVKALERIKFPVLDLPGPAPSLNEPRQRVFLAGAPHEDVEELRDELARLLLDQGSEVVPETNPLDMDEVHECAPEWVLTCDKFAQVLGSRYGKWKHDKTGLVKYQHALAKQHQKPIYVYRAPQVNLSSIKDVEYRTFLEGFDQEDTGTLEHFAARVLMSRRKDHNLSVYMMSGPRDRILEEEIRKLMKEMNVSVYPFSLSAEKTRDLATIANDDEFIGLLKRCGAIVLLAGNAKSSLWLERAVSYIEWDISQKLGCFPPCAVIDAPPPPPVDAPKRVSVLLKDSPSFKDELQKWLLTLSSRFSAYTEGSAHGGLH